MTVSRFVILVIVLFSAAMAAGCTGDSEMPFEIPGSTSVVVAGATSVSGLGEKGVQDPESLRLLPSLRRFDLVTFDHAAINKKLESGQGLPVRIRGKEYTATMSRMNFAATDNGIYSYRGKLDGEKSSEVLFTTSSNLLTGRFTLNGETFWIEAVENRSRGRDNPAPLHVIYRSEDVVNRGPIKLCGGGFEVYRLNQDPQCEGEVISVTEQDIANLPELGEVLRGEKESYCTNRSFRINTTCAGGGSYHCEDGANISRYASPSGYSSKFRNCLEYRGVYYILSKTWIS
ncbi:MULTISPECIES: hypothetical protein [unclassified Methanoregula]|uniref:hypothetical protein n=1 Tax=unclassified Methanoregula TaxID=2649730 RepID=UPI0009C6607B|nr:MULTISPECIES: hypothetical protein [unclassified Methanoregula]OPX62182.1 MAG: hypothetical protein A4E33_02448 [Methanoregula sp. PtaB.Bin085]OPY35609.1 MAG: hypothetical protein A4E34_00609 [Methanoregula sp. PtaU1.Bin006]